MLGYPARRIGPDRVRLKPVKPVAAGVFLVCLLAAAPAGAADLKLGGYVASSAADGAEAPLAASGLPAPDTGGMTMTFTPRGSGSFYGTAPAEGLAFEMGLDNHWASTRRLDAMGFDYDREDKDEMMVGGALLLDDVRLDVFFEVFGSDANVPTDPDDRNLALVDSTSNGRHRDLKSFSGLT